MPFELEAVWDEEACLRFVAPMAMKVPDLDAYDPHLGSLELSDESKAGVAATRLIGRLLVPLVLEGEHSSAKVKVAVDFLVPVLLGCGRCDASCHKERGCGMRGV